MTRPATVCTHNSKVFIPNRVDQIDAIFPILSLDENISVLNGMYNAATGKKSTEDEEEIPIKSARKGTMTGSDEDPSERHNDMEDVKEKDVDAVSTTSSTADYNKFLSVVNDNTSDMA